MVKLLVSIFFFALAFIISAAPVAAQTPTITPTLTLTPTLLTPVPEWMFPEGGLQPYTYTHTAEPLYEIDRDDLWVAARIALTTYNILGLDVWAIIAVVIILPIVSALIFKIFTNPPEV